mgnify:CR=1 FL=1
MVEERQKRLIELYEKGVLTKEEEGLLHGTRGGTRFSLC